MKDIDKDFYCVLGDRIKGHSHLCGGICTDCPLKHRKHPTPEQYKEEYGEEWTGVVYGRRSENRKWVFGSRLDFVPETLIVCACTPFGMPDNNWRPV